MGVPTVPSAREHDEHLTLRIPPDPQDKEEFDVADGDGIHFILTRHSIDLLLLATYPKNISAKACAYGRDWSSRNGGIAEAPSDIALRRALQYTGREIAAEHRP